MRGRIGRALEWLIGLFVCLYVAGIPGSTTRPVVVELSASPVPKEITDRDGVLDVVVSATDDHGAGGSPIAGARVRAFAILDGRAHAAGATTTDATGRATLRDLPHAEHWIVAEAEGRMRASQMVVIVSGARRLDLDLGPEHRLDVEVKTEQNTPLANAEIEVRGADPFPVGARTGANGKANVGRLGEGPFTVTVRVPGYEEVTRRHVPEGTPLVVTLGKQGALLVKVIGDGDRPVAGARVLVASPSLWPARAAETNADGTVRIGGLDSGTYAMRAVHGALVSPIELGVSLSRGEEKQVELRLGPGIMLNVRVVDALDGEGVARARVTVAESGLSPFPLEALTDKAGRVVMGPIARGGASISARADGFVAKGALHVDDVPPQEISIGLLRGGILVGKISDTRGYAVDGATIRIIGTDLEGMPIDEDPQRAAFREAHFSAALEGPRPLIPAGELGVMPGPLPPIPHGTPLGISLAGSAPGSPPPRVGTEEPWVSARDGRFEAKPIPPGRVRALVRHPQYVEALSEIVAIASEKETKVDVVLSRGGILEGRVRDVRGAGVAGAQVAVLAVKGSLERMTRTGTDGSFAFAALPEAITVLVSRGDDPSQVVARLDVTVPESGKKWLDITLPEARPPLPVRVKTDRGQAVDAAQVTAVSLDPSEALRTTVFTDGRGSAELPSAKGLPLRVEVRAPGRAAKIVVTTPELATLVVELGAAESVTGEVWANRRETVEGAEVALTTDTGTRHARTNKDGVFTIAEVTPGPARLRVRAKGRAPVVRDVVVDESGGRRATALPRIELPEEGVVEGTVVDGRGDPIAGARVGKDSVPTYLPVGALPPGMAVADARGRFRLSELAEGTIVLEAYSPEIGRARLTGVRVLSGRTTDRVRITITRDAQGAAAEPLATGGVAVTLGETAAGLDLPEVVIVAVSEGSEAERAGLAPNDIVVEVAGQKVKSITEARARLSGPVHDDVVVKVRRGQREVVLRVAREAVRR
ncbi:MAG: carboxypeptidase regulatory-like domain-containing protein [Deltaproteobacteria bacterium]|nr:carboxypeptidase regulatory-like domain-containing protein [Deltaproteobacteria bacterium]